MQAQRGRKWSVTLIGLALAAAVLALPRGAAAQSLCLGDCDGNGSVDIADLLVGVNIALGDQPISVCPAFDNGSGMVTIAVLMVAVNNALFGCPQPLVVDTLADTTGTGACSLRDAISTANGAPVSGSGCGTAQNSAVVFADGLSGSIGLTSTLPTITGALIIAGPTDGREITISGGQSVRILDIGGAAVVVLENLTIANGDNVEGSAGIANAGTLTVRGCTLSGNRSSRAGGAIGNSGGTVLVSDSTFLDNGAGSSGGAIFSNGGAVSVADSTFAGNSNGDGTGGAIDMLGDSTLAVSGCTFSANAASGSGGAIASNGMVTVLNSTFVGNTTLVGPGAALAIQPGGNFTVTASTFSANAAPPQFAGNTLVVADGAAISFKSTILVRAPELFTPICLRAQNGTITNAGFNIASDGSCAFGTMTGASGQTLGDNVDALLDPAGLQDNGGPTATVALTAESPAVAAIPPASCTDQAGDPITTDQRGEPRPTSAPCDVGAFELSQ